MIKIDPEWIENFERKKFKKDFNIDDIDKKYKYINKNLHNKAININFIEVFFLLKIFFIKNTYRDIKLLILELFDNLKISFLNIFKIQKKCNFSDLVIFSKHRYIDQINFSEISNFLFKKTKNIS